MKQVNGILLKTAGTSEGTKGERGFTLIEAAVALVIMMIVGLGVASLFAYSTRNNSGAADRAAAIAIAQQRMERLRSVEYDDVSLNAGTTTVVVTSNGRNYQVQTTICTAAACGGGATIKHIMVRVTPTSGDTVWSRNSLTITSLRASSALGVNMQ